MDTLRWAQILIAAFPNLSDEGFEIVEQSSESYNCMAYAAGDTTEWWWPNGIDYWPPWATLNNKIESLVEMFAGLEYEQCDDSNAKIGYEKVALYENEGEFEHAALQMPNGRWRSKMGEGPVIEHPRPESLAGGMYGDPTILMRRRRG